MYGEVAWFGAAPFAAPSVVEDVPLPGWVDASVNAITVALHYMLTVPFEPSVVPLELFCMTTVEDLESVMVVVCTNESFQAGRDELATSCSCSGGECKSLLYISSEPPSKWKCRK